MNTLIKEQFLPISLEEAWAFFSNPGNLNEITPPELEFRITSEIPAKAYPGLIITYRIKPMLNIPVTWVTEITHVQEPYYFVDNQIKGPYRTWHHEHHFRAVEGGVMMKDILYYDIGMSVLGWLAGILFVHNKVKAIFDYREEVLEKYFANKTNLNVRGSIPALS